MDIIVLMKQVPDTEASVEIADSGDRLYTEDLKWTINPYDEYALEEALQIKESRDDVTVTAVTVGPQRVAEAIRVAYAMGVDNAVHVNDEMDDEVFGAVDAHTTSTILAKVIEGMPHDLIISGNRAVDDDNCQVPATLSHLLDIPMITLVTGQEIREDAIVCDMAIDGGTAKVKAGLPALITVQKGINEPRYPAFRAIMKAKKKKADVLELSDIGLAGGAVGMDGALVRVSTMAYPPERGGGTTINGGDAAVKATELVRLLKEKSSVL